MYRKRVKSNPFGNKVRSAVQYQTKKVKKNVLDKLTNQVHEEEVEVSYHVLPKHPKTKYLNKLKNWSK